MCLICVDLMKQKITAAEARRNLNEIVIGKEIKDEDQKHVSEVLDLIEQVQNHENLG